VKLARSLSLLREAAAENPHAVVMLSGGKDSLATLSLCKQVFPRVTCLYMYLVRGLRFIEDHLVRVTRQHDVEILFLPHPQLSTYLQNGSFMYVRTDVTKIRKVLFRDVYRSVLASTGAGWIADGQREVDSINRRTWIRTHGALNRKYKRLHPISEWLDAEVYSYLRAKRVPLPVRLGDARMSGFDLEGPVLRLVKERFPDDYRRILDVFPFAEASVFREELRAKRQASEEARRSSDP
jgi:phosphoadenosine phosphosulfate reductase